MMAITSGEMFLPRFAAFSIDARTLRINASTSSDRSGAASSGNTSSLAWRHSPSVFTDSTRARDTP